METPLKSRPYLEKVLELDQSHSEGQEELAWCDYLQGNHEAALSRLSRCSPPTSRVLLRLGRIYFHTLPDKALGLFLQAAKLDPTNAEAFVGLGDYYRSKCQTGNEDEELRWIKCYQKAYQLDPLNSIAINHLSLYYLQKGDEAQKKVAESLLTELVTNAAERVAWAWRRLGFLQLVFFLFSKILTQRRE